MADHIVLSEYIDRLQCGCPSLVLVVVLAVLGCQTVQDRPAEATEMKNAAAAARRMITAGEGRLAPVYAPLAEYLVQQYKLAGANGIGSRWKFKLESLVVDMFAVARKRWPE